jgi:hypothetical protein
MSAMDDASRLFGRSHPLAGTIPPLLFRCPNQSDSGMFPAKDETP